MDPKEVVSRGYDEISYRFMATLGHTAWTGTEENWLGARMYWSHADHKTYTTWLTDLGFLILWARFIPEGKGGHTLLLSQKR